MVAHRGAIGSRPTGDSGPGAVAEGAGSLRRAPFAGQPVVVTLFVFAEVSRINPMPDSVLRMKGRRRVTLSCRAMRGPGRFCLTACRSRGGGGPPGSNPDPPCVPCLAKAAERPPI